VEVAAMRIFDAIPQFGSHMFEVAEVIFGERYG
jgi:hypothetical protein